MRNWIEKNGGIEKKTENKLKDEKVNRDRKLVECLCNGDY